MIARPSTIATTRTNRQNSTTRTTVLRLFAAIRSRKVGAPILELHLGGLAHGGHLGRVELEEIDLAEAEDIAQRVGREAHQRRVVLADHVVVVLPGEADAVLG